MEWLNNDLVFAAVNSTFHRNMWVLCVFFYHFSCKLLIFQSKWPQISRVLIYSLSFRPLSLRPRAISTKKKRNSFHIKITSRFYECFNFLHGTQVHFKERVQQCTQLHHLNYHLLYVDVVWIAWKQFIDPQHIKKKTRANCCKVILISDERNLQKSLFISINQAHFSHQSSTELTFIFIYLLCSLQIQYPPTIYSWKRQTVQSELWSNFGEQTQIVSIRWTPMTCKFCIIVFYLV